MYQIAGTVFYFILFYFILFHFILFLFIFLFYFIYFSFYRLAVRLEMISVLALTTAALLEFCNGVTFLQVRAKIFSFRLLILGYLFSF